MFTPLNGADLPFDVLNEQLVSVPLGHRKHSFEAFQFRLLLVIHPKEYQSLAHAGRVGSVTLNKLARRVADFAGALI